MKQSNGYVQEPMSSPDPDQEVIPQDDHQANNISTTFNSIEGPQFSLAIKPKGTPLFRLSALYKSRLKFCIFLHFLLFLAMLAKLSEDILDRLDVFILELEELYIPKPLPWEWLWTASILFAIVGLRALSRNRLSALNSYAAGTFVLAICPLLGAAIYFLNDILEYAEKKGEAEVQKWQGYPVAVYWYGFIMVAFQIHMFSIFFAAKLIKIWRVKMKRF
ncbi:protein jagunal-like [Uloborus diversus]|uniref:protein jagunal-like n=1 Tax=Uloborus diversus TaxID=327109 RepID=UPI0024099BB4|nr:protein jagunal-like [Uloborus diversus]